MRFFALLLLVALGAVEVRAQIVVAPPDMVPVVGEATAAKTSAVFTPVHVSDWLAELPESKAALAEYHALKDAGLLPVARKGAADPLFTTQNFRVYNFARSEQTQTTQYDQINFTLVRDEPRFLLWVQTSGLGTTVSEEVIERLRTALGDSTPTGSYNPNAGIIENDETIFGSPPNVDGDGKTDVLLVDIVDGYDPVSKPYAITGFFFPPDLASPVRRDILYLDTNPSLAFSEDEVLVTAAHEYQHLIHWRYDAGEHSFVNEGLSEWASTMNGYEPRRVDYVQKLNLQRNTLIDWPADTGLGDDYERASLFTTYLAERLGPLATGSLTRSTLKGAAGYQSVLQGAGLDLTAVTASWAMANLVNDRALGDDYGYADATYRTVRAAVRTEVDGSASSSFGPLVEGPVARGGSDFYRITDVGAFTITIDAPDGTSNPGPLRSQLKPIVVLRAADGSSSVQRLDLSTRQTWTFPGSFDEILVSVTHAALTGTSAFLTYEISASWEAAQVTMRREDVAYDDGRIVRTSTGAEVYVFRGGDSNTAWEEDSRGANRFELPEGAQLRSVSVAPIYPSSPGANTFSSTPPTGAKDFTISLWADDGDGRPAEPALFTMTRNDARASLFEQAPNGDVLYFFDTVDMTAYKDAIGPLPRVLHISVGNAGTDANAIGMPLASYTATEADPSPSSWYIHLSGVAKWATFAGIFQGGDPNNRPFAGRVLPIRASFLVPISTATEPGDDLPTAVELEPNYPNPFNPQTTLTFSLDRPSRARLTVHDLLGRLVATLVDEPRAAGRHEVRFDASGLASGVYVYRLETERGNLARTMALVR